MGRYLRLVFCRIGIFLWMNPGRCLLSLVGTNHSWFSSLMLSVFLLWAWSFWSSCWCSSFERCLLHLRGRFVSWHLPFSPSGSASAWCSRSFWCFLLLLRLGPPWWCHAPACKLHSYCSSGPVLSTSGLFCQNTSFASSVTSLNTSTAKWCSSSLASPCWFYHQIGWAPAQPTSSRPSGRTIAAPKASLCSFDKCPRSSRHWSLWSPDSYCLLLEARPSWAPICFSVLILNCLLATASCFGAWKSYLSLCSVL